MHNQSDLPEEREPREEGNSKQIGKSEEQSSFNPISNSKPVRKKSIVITVTDHDSQISQKSNSPPLPPASNMRSSALQEIEPRDGSTKKKQDVSFALKRVRSSLEINQPAGLAQPCNRVSDSHQPKKGSLSLNLGSNYKNQKNAKAQQFAGIKMMPLGCTPKVPIKLPLQQTGNQNILNNMLTAWYWTGYYSGLEKRLAEGN